MQLITLSGLIGLEIVAIRYHYTSEDYGLQWFYAYLKLNDGTIIDIPQFDDNDYLELTEDNKKYLQERFDTGTPVNEKCQKECVGQKIEDFFFTYEDNETDGDESAYIKLSNGYYLTERNCGPMGISGIDLLLLTEEQFLDETTNAEKDIRSFLNTHQKDETII